MTESGTSDGEGQRSSLPDTGVAATGCVCQNFPEHPGEEVEMVSAGPGEGGVVCPECGRMAGGPDDEIPYGDPPEYATDGGRDLCTSVSEREEVSASTTREGSWLNIIVTSATGSSPPISTTNSAPTSFDDVRTAVARRRRSRGDQNPAHSGGNHRPLDTGSSRDDLRTDGGTDADRMVEFSIEVTQPVAEQIVAAAALTGQHPIEFIEQGVLTQLQAVDNILHGDEHVDLPEDFDQDAWRVRYEKIRRPELYEGGQQ